MITYRIKPLLIFVLSSCLLMTGCSSSTQPIEYYQFAHSPSADQAIVKPTSIALVLADPVLFGAISNRGIAMKYSANQMRNARSHLWDQPLDGMVFLSVKSAQLYPIQTNNTILNYSGSSLNSMGGSHKMQKFLGCGELLNTIMGWLRAYY